MARVATAIHNNLNAHARAPLLLAEAAILFVLVPTHNSCRSARGCKRKSRRRISAELEMKGDSYRLKQSKGRRRKYLTAKRTCGMKDLRLREPVVSELLDRLPRELVLLAASLSRVLANDPSSSANLLIGLVPKGCRLDVNRCGSPGIYSHRNGSAHVRGRYREYERVKDRQPKVYHGGRDNEDDGKMILQRCHRAAFLALYDQPK